MATGKSLQPSSSGKGRFALSKGTARYFLSEGTTVYQRPHPEAPRESGASKDEAAGGWRRRSLSTGTSFEAASRRLRTRVYAHDRKELDPQRRNAEDRDRRGDLCRDGGRGVAGVRAGGPAADGAEVFFVLRGKQPAYYEC
jgi:hypothetical protein